MSVMRRSRKNRVADAPQKRQFSTASIKRLMGYLKPYRTGLVIVVLLVILSAVASVASSLFLKALIDDYIAPMLKSPQPDYAPLLMAIGKMALLLGAGIFASWVYGWMMVFISQKALKTIRDELFSKMQRLPLKYFDTHEHGDIMSIYTNDVDTLRQMIAQSLPQAISALLTIIAVMASMLYLSFWLSLIILVGVVIILKLVKDIAMKSGPYFVDQQKTLASLDSYVEEIIHGEKVVKVFSYEDKTIAEMRKRNKAWEEAAGLANGHAMSIMPTMNFFGYLLYDVIAICGALMALAHVTNLSLAGSGVFTVGIIASFMTLSRSFIQPIVQIANQFNSIITALAGADRIFALLDEAPEVDEGQVVLVNTKEVDGKLIESETHTGQWAWKNPALHGEAALTCLRGHVILDDVCFGYQPEKEILHNITLYAEPGQKVAFVGATGAGKTTITNLINRFYDIDKGKITYDGIDIKAISKADLRRSLGVVLQDVNLFTDTVMENIRYGNPQATDEECIQAAKLANADEFIRMLPEGYQTVLKGDGSGLSQGQRQLISIARAAVSNPPVMILDEATSSIDTRTEAIVQAGMDNLMEGRTVFVIAHRLSTVKNADVVMVLDHGRIIERGSHQDLINQKGVYYQLYTGAFELE